MKLIKKKLLLFQNPRTTFVKICKNVSTCVQVPSNDDPTLADKEAILASLNIKAMTFDDTIGVLSSQSKFIMYYSFIDI